ncbi:Trp biosynthesis-associated membrane protein [Leifsonia sp. NPDC058292]|uniref:Trp biosynthesis-associated membrane protein n=1 Tax=Leifsonia sp. NPDC058292 TaxID=3346428 RepID=UPI0036DAA3B1
MADTTEPSGDPRAAEGADAATDAPAARRGSRGAKYLTLLLVVIGSGLTLLAATQTWFSVLLVPGAGHAGAIVVQGSAAAPALTALSLAGLALTAALAIAGPVFRIVLSLLGVLLGASILISAVSALAAPIQAASSAITGATGVAGDSSVDHLVERVDTQLWPSIAIAGGVVLILASAMALITFRLWPGPSKRYQTRFVDESGTSADDLFAASGEEGANGEVSDAAEARALAEAAEAGDKDAPGAPAIERDRAIDSWDELSRGEDPTR